MEHLYLYCVYDFATAYWSAICLLFRFRFRDGWVLLLVSSLRKFDLWLWDLWFGLIWYIANCVWFKLVARVGILTLQGLEAVTIGVCIFNLIVV